MSPKALADHGDNVRDEPRLRRPVHVQGAGRRRPHHARQVADYYDKAKVHAATIVFRIMTDPSSRTQSLRAGDIQVADRVQSTDVPVLQKDTAVTRDQDADDRLPGADAQHREQERPAEAVLERRHAARAVAVPAAGVRRSRSTERRSTRSSSTALNLPDCYPISPVSPWYVTTKGARSATCARTSRWRRSSSRPPGSRRRSRCT